MAKELAELNQRNETVSALSLFHRFRRLIQFLRPRLQIIGGVPPARPAQVEGGEARALLGISNLFQALGLNFGGLLGRGGS